MPDDGDWPLVLVQGDTGPGNFMFDAGHLTAITDWELAHWGDLHDDLAWLLVRDTLERFPELDRAAWPSTSRRAGSRSTRHGSATSGCSPSSAPPSAPSPGCAPAINGARSRGSSCTTRCTRGCWPRCSRTPRESPFPRRYQSPATKDGTAGCTTWRSATSATSCSPGSTQASPRRERRASRGCSSTCGTADRLGPEFTRQELDEIGALLARPFDDVEPARQAVCGAIEHGALTADAVLPYCLGQAARDTALMRSAMGALADRHLAPVRERQEDTTP